MEGESKHLEKNPNGEPSHLEHDDRSILQSVRVRRNPVLADSANWQFVESELRFVLYCGSVLWAIHLISILI